MDERTWPISVVQITDGALSDIDSFNQCTDGSDQAEACFAGCIKERYPYTTENEIDEALEKGCFRKNGYSIHINNA